MSSTSPCRILPTSGIDNPRYLFQLPLSPLPSPVSGATLPLPPPPDQTSWRRSVHAQPEGHLHLVSEPMFFQHTYFLSHRENRNRAPNCDVTTPETFCQQQHLKLAINVSYGLVSAGISNSPVMSSLYIFCLSHPFQSSV